MALCAVVWLFFLLRRGFVGSNGLFVKPPGNIDLLLQLLSEVVDLPVTKSLVKQSGLGRAIGSIEKHNLVKGTPNESAIVDRVQKVKDAWSASVKARKAQDAVASNSSDLGNSKKRDVSSQAPLSPTAAKRQKADDGKKSSSSLSSLIKRVSGAPNGASASAPTNTEGKSWWNNHVP